MHKVISIDIFKPDSIANAIKSLNEIQEDIDSKIPILLDKLAEIGINKAKECASEEFLPYISFEKKVLEQRQGYCKIAVSGKNVQEMIVEWTTSKGIRTESINAILMNEVGSGFHVQNPDGLEGGYQGALNTYGHAFDKGGWYWKDAQGIVHWSDGSKANLSMHNAYIEMQKQINDVVKEVFR